MRFWISNQLGLVLLAMLVSPALSQQVPTGPYQDEEAYFAATLANTVTIGGTDALGVIQAVELVIDDQVDGRCWTNSTGIAARVRAELETFGVAVYQEPLAFYSVYAPQLLISAVGYRTGGGVCAVSATLDLHYIGTNKMGSLSYTGFIFEFRNPISLWERQTIFTNSDKIDEPLMQQTQEWVDTLIAEIAKARRTEGVQAFLDRWPDPTPMTQAEFDDFLEARNED